jgi:hypothetical protein
MEWMFSAVSAMVKQTAVKDSLYHLLAACSAGLYYFHKDKRQAIVL